MGEPRRIETEHLVSNNFTFGGINTSLRRCACEIFRFDWSGEHTMTMLRNTVLLAIACGVALPAAARDEQKLYPIGQALKSPAAQAKVDPGIRLFFGRQRHPSVTKDFGQWPTNKKTNAFAKSDLQACEWVFLSAVIALQERARKEGGNAVINIVSNYRNIVTSSESEYVCGAGGLIAGVALKGRVVNLGGR